MVSCRGRKEYRRSPALLALIAIIIFCSSPVRVLAEDQPTAVSRATASKNKDTGVAAGSERFEYSCAICHGLDARGNGPFAELLNVKPPDLTLLSRAEGGDFPFSRVYQRIDGRALPRAHGTPAMPIWGQRLKREGGEETYVRGGILEIMLYLESLQQN